MATAPRDLTQPNYVRSLDVTSASFDGTDTANVAASFKTQESNGSSFNPWKRNGGFIVKPTTDGTVDVLTWEDYERNAKVVDDGLVQTISVLGGKWEETRVVKVYTSSAVKTMDIGQQL